MCDTLPTVLNLAAAGGIDLASASDMVTDAMSALGMGTDEAVMMVDQMAKTSSTTNTSVAQLGDAILTIGATAKSVKGGTAELNTALGILANNGIKGAEGVRGDIAFAQSCLETGNFSFAGSAVTLEQNNFCGMGVTANGLKGNSFSTAQLGIRAQVQHLKAYASTEPLKGECIDPRFK